MDDFMGVFTMTALYARIDVGQNVVCKVYKWSSLFFEDF